MRETRLVGWLNPVFGPLALVPGRPDQTAAHHPLGREAPRQADARFDVLPVRVEGKPTIAAGPRIQQSALEVEPGYLAGQRVGLAERKAAHHAVVAFGARGFVIPPQAQIQRQRGSQFPIVLHEQGVVFVAVGGVYVAIDRPGTGRAQQERGELIAGHRIRP